MKPLIAAALPNAARAGLKGFAQLCAPLPRKTCAGLSARPLQLFTQLRALPRTVAVPGREE